MKKLITILASAILVSGCQLLGPIFVDYNGVRMDVAKWINQQSLLTMQQKRSLAQLSRAQQKLVRIDQIPNERKIEISTENAMAIHCATQHLTAHKITQLQDRVFNEDKQRILDIYSDEFPQVKLDPKHIQCD